ncbi:MAG: HAD hydrolase family protein [Saprospiraceae bacterium]|nr:HAD hydrolase family protein [Saprospiraceae bacterium]
MSFLNKLHDISTFIFDVDGVLTDGSVYAFEDGNLMRKMNTKDGFAIRHAIKQGYRIIIITGGRSEGVVKRLKRLGIEDVYYGIQNKIDTLKQLINLYSIDLGRVLYMGDDLPDYECMRLCHLATCPSDAVHEIKEISQYISPIDGGQGCVRDVIEKVLRVQKQWVSFE